MLASMALEVVWGLWRAAEHINDLDAEQRERNRRHPRRMRMLNSAEVPLWVLSALQGMSMMPPSAFCECWPCWVSNPPIWANW
jgi:hypothetical protein